MRGADTQAVRLTSFGLRNEDLEVGFACSDLRPQIPDLKSQIPDDLCDIIFEIWDLISVFISLS